MSIEEAIAKDEENQTDAEWLAEQREKHVKSFLREARRFATFCDHVVCEIVVTGQFYRRLVEFKQEHEDDLGLPAFVEGGLKVKRVVIRPQEPASGLTVHATSAEEVGVSILLGGAEILVGRGFELPPFVRLPRRSDDR